MRPIALLAVFLFLPHTLAAQDRPKDDKGVGRREGTLKVGDPAPDFEVKGTAGKKAVKLSELKGKPVVLIFGSCT